jgi:amino acid transporter
LVAAAALLLDYVLTVAVSIAAGVAAVTSAFPEWHVNTVELSLGFLALIMIGNLRGIRESGRIFSVPTFFFLGSMGVLLVVGAYKVFTGQVIPIESAGNVVIPAETASLSVFLVLRAFANGCTALTGIEAISDGVPAFKPPEAKNAAMTLLVMAGCAVTLFMGVTLLAGAFHVIPRHEETVISQLNRAILGGRGPFYYMVQFATTMILVLAANTAFSDFPRLASIIARDKFLPRQLANQGDRLAFSNGIVMLSCLSGVLLFAFGGDTHKLIPLYMLGVFVSFTLSQTGMVIKWRRERKRGWRVGAFVNGLGATLTLIVLFVVSITKFREGAWVIIVLIPILVAHFLAIHRHYEKVAQQLSLKGVDVSEKKHNTVIVPIGGVHRAVVQALEYARTLSDDVRAVYVDVDPHATAEIRDDWERWGNGIRLEILASPFRSVMEPLLEYIELTNDERPDDFVTVLLPEFVPARWWHHLLHNQRALLIKGALLFRPHIVVTSVPYHLSD